MIRAGNEKRLAQHTEYFYKNANPSEINCNPITPNSRGASLLRCQVPALAAQPLLQSNPPQPEFAVTPRVHLWSHSSTLPPTVMQSTQLSVSFCHYLITEKRESQWKLTLTQLFSFTNEGNCLMVRFGSLRGRKNNNDN